MRRLFLLLLLAAVIPAIAVTAQRDTDPSTVQRVTVPELKKLQATGSVTVVDVRDPEAYAEGHIPGALLVPLDDDLDVSRLTNAKKPIVFYCA